MESLLADDLFRILIILQMVAVPHIRPVLADVGIC
jgi:hypothetical protein